MTRQLVDAQYRVVEVTSWGEIYHGPYAKLGTAKGVRSQLKSGSARPIRRWKRWDEQAPGEVSYDQREYRIEKSTVTWTVVEDE